MCGALTTFQSVMDIHTYRIARKFGGLAVYLATAKLKIHQYFVLAYIYVHVWRSLTDLLNLNTPILLQW